MADYIVTVSTEKGEMSDRIYGKRSASGAVEEAIERSPLREWLEKEIVDEDTVATVTTKTTEHEVTLGDVLE